MKTGTSESTTAAIRLDAALPRVNLLPPEIARRDSVRRMQVGVGAVVAAALATVAGGYLMANGSASAAQQELDDSRAEQSRLTQETTRYALVPATAVRVQAAEGQLTQAMGSEVRWSTHLDAVARSVPANVWLTTLTAAQSSADGPTATGSPDAGGGIGTVQFVGRGFAHDDVAEWLESLARQKGYANPFFTESRVKDDSGRESVEFTSTVVVTADALSNRWTKGGR